MGPPMDLTKTGHIMAVQHGVRRLRRPKDTDRSGFSPDGVAAIFQRQAELSRKAFEQGCVFYDVGDYEQQDDEAGCSDGEHSTASEGGQVWYGTSKR